MLGTDIFHFNYKNYLCIVDYHSKFPVVKRLEGLSAESLITTTKVIFTKYGISQKLMSDAGTNFVSEKFWQFSKTINAEQEVSSAYHHQSNGHIKECTKFIKCTFKKCADSGGGINMALLQFHTTPLGQGLPNLATLMFNRKVHGIMPVLDHKPVGQECDEENDSKLVDRPNKNNNNASPVFAFLPTGSAVANQHEDRGLWTHGTIVGTGDHNHHDHASTIQLTTNGRQITHNR